jgi:hypothetical protein
LDSQPTLLVKKYIMSCNYRVVGSVICFLIAFNSFGQELFPLNESASSVPKGVLGVRIFTQNHKEVDRNRSLDALRIMYGLTSKLSITLTGSISNHHDTKLPPDLVNHSHSGNQTNYFTQNIKRGAYYPYLYNGTHLFAKYRVISVDRKNEHLRIAAYGEWSNVGVAHDEAEPNLMDDTGGYGLGVIATWLKNRFAASVTYGFIKPDPYFEIQPDITGGPDLPTEIHYGNAFKYNLSLGYRLAPAHYTDYDQTNWNLYLEFIGKKYDAARVIQNGNEITTKAIALTSGSYVEIHPGVQRIVKSNLRIDFSVGLPFVGNSYVHTTPIWTLGVQRYFYRINKSKL